MSKIIMTDGSRTETIFQTKYNPEKATKGLNPFTDETPGAWSPPPADTQAQAKSTRLVPSVFAGINARMQSMMDLPFTIYGKGDKVVDDSDDYKNVLGFLPNPQRVFGLSEAALVTNGKAYWYKGIGERTQQVKELRYWLPASVTLNRDALKRSEILFERTGADRKFTDKEVLYFWGYDENVEIGPPTIYPLLSAMIAAEANGSITAWVRDYMLRGAIKAMLLAVDGAPPPGEVERMESWWKRFMSGARGMMEWKVFNMANVKPTIIGDGLEALRDLSVSKDLRYEIHQALGTRHLLEDENLATADARERQFYTQDILPDARLIQQGMNEQILQPLGYHLEFEPQRLEIFQENEAEQTQSFSDLFTVFSGVMTEEIAFQLASEKLDYQFTDEQQLLIKKGIADKQARAVDVKPEQVKPEQVKPEPMPKEPVAKALVELDRWEKKITKAGKMVTWHAAELSAEMVKGITDGVITFEQARASIGGAVNDTAIMVLAGKLDKLIEAAHE